MAKSTSYTWLDNFDGPAVGEITIGAELYEEAFAIFKKFNPNLQANNVLIENIQSIEQAVEFASCVEEDAVWSQVVKAQLREGMVSDAIESFIRVDDATEFLDVIKAVELGNVYHGLVKYLLMARKKIKEQKVDSELIYAFTRIDRLGEIKEFIMTPNGTNLQSVGDRLFDEALYEAAKIIFTFISNWEKLNSTLVKLGQFQGGVDASRKVSDYYQNMGHFDELISLMESGLGLERAHMGIFMELGILYARYRPDKLMEHIKLFSTGLNIPRLICFCDE